MLNKYGVFYTIFLEILKNWKVLEILKCQMRPLKAAAEKIFSHV